MLGERRSRAGWCADLSEAFKNPDVEETEAATEREQKEEKGRLPENRPCTGKEPGRMKSSDLFFASGESRDFSSVLREVQGYLSKEYSGLVTAGGSDEVKAQIRRFAGKYIQDHRICVAGMGTEELIDAIYSEMAEFGFLTKYVYGEGIEEIDINAWDDVEVQFSGGETRKLEEHFESPEHAVNVVRRMLHVSGMVLDDASPSVLGHLAKNIRIAVLKTPVVDEDVGVAASIRIVNPQNMKKEDFIDGGTATEEMLDFLAECIRYGISVCVAGATSSGKTTLLGWLLTTIPDNKRIYSIENGSRELALVRRKEGRVVNSVIHTLTRDSENERQRIDQTALLDMALRFNPDIIVVGEMRGPEANAAQEAARTGVAVVTTIHSMGYAVIKVFFANLKRGGILLIQISVGSLYLFSVPRGYTDGFISWCKQVVGLCLTAFLQAVILTAGLMAVKDHALLGMGLMLSAGEVPRIAGQFGLDTTTRANVTGAFYAAQGAINLTRSVVQAITVK